MPIRTSVLARFASRLALVLAFFLPACGGGSGGGPEAGPGTPAASADISLLFMGNSHTTVNDLSGKVTAMVRAARPGRTVAQVVAPGGYFLDERVNDPASMGLLRSQSWSFVVLQAQKYSASGQLDYSTAEAQALVRAARAANAVPILFPEWPRRGVAETQLIYDLHASIAQKEPACVAPVGQAWDLSLARYPALALHDPDGNHSAPAGAFLAALVLAATITGASPFDIPYLPDLGVDAETQARLRGVAAETVLVVPPRRWCPADRS
jgi:hypothetical protein